METIEGVLVGGSWMASVLASSPRQTLVYPIVLCVSRLMRNTLFTSPLVEILRTHQMERALLLYPRTPSNSAI